jgi:hypothetical protein
MQIHLTEPPGDILFFLTGQIFDGVGTGQSYQKSGWEFSTSRIDAGDILV